MVGNYATYESLVDGFSNVPELARVRKQVRVLASTLSDRPLPLLTSSLAARQA